MSMCVFVFAVHVDKRAFDLENVRCMCDHCASIRKTPEIRHIHPIAPGVSGRHDGGSTRSMFVKTAS